MFKRKKMEGLLAESLYQELNSADRAALDAYLATHSEVAKDAHAFQSMIEAIPAERVSLTHDLMPELRRRLAEDRPQRLVFSRPLIAAFAACGLAAMVVGYGFYSARYFDSNEPVVHIAALSPVGQAFAQAQELASQHNYSGAYVVLAETLTEHPNDPLTAEATTFLADVAFTELRWYPQALQNYSSLQRDHFAVFSANPESVERWQLLAESAGPAGEFAVLHELDNARGSENFEALEHLVAKNPATFVAGLAATDMARLAVAGEDLANVENPRLYAMETALGRCTDEVAKMQLKVELALVLEDTQGDAKARSLYEEVVQGGNAVLARYAENRLRVLEDQK